MERVNFNPEWYGVQAKVLSRSERQMVVDYGCNGRGIVKDVYKRQADELSIASITRGIENPKPRTCLVQIHIGPADLLAGVCFAAYLAVGLYWKGVFG